MLKRIIFDVDNTLIKWKSIYDKTYEYALDELGIKYTREELNKVIEASNTYENYYDYFDKKNMSKLVSKFSNLNIPNTFVDVWMKYLSNCYDEDDKKVLDTLKYLSNKYELAILSNWFSYSQIKRLESLGMDKYFKEMIFTDTVKNKPSKEAFIKAIGTHKPNECIMIGDNLEIDIMGALNAGLEAILYDPNNKINYKNKIKDLKELEELL